MLLRENLEQAIIECNLIIHRWRIDRPKLVNYDHLRGLIIQHLKKAVNKSMTWREARSFFALRLLYFGIDQEKGYINSLTLSEDAKLIREPKATTVIEILKDLNYEVLGRKSMERTPTHVVELEQISFSSLQRITF